MQRQRLADGVASSPGGFSRSFCLTGLHWALRGTVLGKPGQHFAAGGLVVSLCRTTACLVFASCLWRFFFQSCGKAKDGQRAMPNKPAPAHLSRECGTERPRSGWKPLQIFPSKEHLTGPLSREFDCKRLWLLPVCVICSKDVVNSCNATKLAAQRLVRRGAGRQKLSFVCFISA